MNEKLVTIMNFSHIYDDEDFYQNENINWLDCTQISSSNGYASQEALQQIQDKIKDLSVHGIHFIDNGNYHYLTKLWIEKIDEPFILVVFDHHSDMQKPLYDDFLSCGSWIMDSLKDNAYLQKVIFVGIDQKQMNLIDTSYHDKIECIDDLSMMYNDVFLSTLCDNYPIYISIDKDVLSQDVVKTTWDQGIMTLDELTYFLTILLQKKTVIGVDICGECPLESNDFKNIQKDNQVNLLLLQWIKKLNH